MKQQKNKFNSVWAEGWYYVFGKGQSPGARIFVWMLFPVFIIFFPIVCLLVVGMSGNERLPDPRAGKHSFRCKECGTTEHGTEPIAYLSFTDGDETCMKCGGDKFRNRTSDGNLIAVVELTSQ